MQRYKLDKRHRKENDKAIFNVVVLLFNRKTHKLFFCSLYGTFKLVLSCRLAPWHSVKRADFCPFDLLMTCPYNSQCRGENQSTCWTDCQNFPQLLFRLKCVFLRIFWTSSSCKNDVTPSIVNVTMPYVINDVMKIQTGNRMTSRRSVHCPCSDFSTNESLS